MKRILIMLVCLVAAGAAMAQTVSFTAPFGAVYAVDKGLPYFGVQPAVTVGLSKSSIKALVEVGNYDVVDDVRYTGYPINVSVAGTFKEVENLTVGATAWVNDVLGALSWSVAPSASYVLGPLTPAVSMTLDKAMLLPTTWSVAFALKGVPVTATASVIQSSIGKVPETVKLTGAVSF